MKNKLEKQNMENQMRAAADWEPLARGILQEPRLFQIGFVGICEGAGATTVAAAAAAAIGRQHGRTVFAEGQRPQPGRMRTLDYLGLEQVLKKGKLPIYQDVNWQIAGFGGQARDDFGDGGRQGRGVNRRRTDESPRGGFADSDRQGRGGSFEKYGGRARDDFGDGGRQGRGVNRRRTDESPRGGFADSDRQGRGGSFEKFGGWARDGFENCGRLACGAACEGTGGAVSRDAAALTPAGGIWILDEPPQAQWQRCDVLVCVVDPLPARVLAGLARHHRLRAEQKERESRGEHSLLWVMNKENPAVDRRELERFLKIRFDAALPLLPTEFFYQAAYQEMPWIRSLYAKETLFQKRDARTDDFRDTIETLSSAIFSRLPQFVI